MQSLPKDKRDEKLPEKKDPRQLYIGVLEKKLRDERRFADKEDLIDQIKIDEYRSHMVL